jgi:hypothetical protein
VLAHTTVLFEFHSAEIFKIVLDWYLPDETHRAPAPDGKLLCSCRPSRVSRPSLTRNVSFLPRTPNTACLFSSSRSAESFQKPMRILVGRVP